MTKYAHQCADCRNWFLADSPQREYCDYCAEMRRVMSHRAANRRYRARLRVRPLLAHFRAAISAATAPRLRKALLAVCELLATDRRDELDVETVKAILGGVN